MLACLTTLAGAAAYAGPVISPNPTLDIMAELAEAEAVLADVATDVETVKRTIEAEESAVAVLLETFRKFGDASAVVDRLSLAEQRLIAVGDDLERDKQSLAAAQFTLKKLSRVSGKHVTAEFRSRLRTAIAMAKSLGSRVADAEEQRNWNLSVIARFWEEIAAG